MRTISFETKGDFKKTDTFLRRVQNLDPVSILEKYGALGIERLKERTPKDTGLTSDSWSYEVKRDSEGYSIKWYNSNRTITGVPIVILLQYGHGTRGGTWVEGLDFVNPALRTVFLQMAKELREEVSNGKRNR